MNIVDFRKDFLELCEKHGIFVRDENQSISLDITGKKIRFCSGADLIEGLAGVLKINIEVVERGQN